MDLPPEFFTVYGSLPRAGPGSDRTTLEALSRLPTLAPEARVIDLGCGPGRQTLTLARALSTPIVAVDLYAPFLDRLRQSALDAGVDAWIQPRHADFAALDDPDASFDLVWSEGAIYLLEFAKGLAAWRRLLRPHGLMAVSEITWLVDDPPPEVQAFWNAEVPAMSTIRGNSAAARAAGMEVFDTFTLPDACWFDEYYTPLRARIAELTPGAREFPALARVLEEAEQEIAMYDRFGDSYGYVFYLLRRTD